MSNKLYTLYQWRGYREEQDGILEPARRQLLHLYIKHRVYHFTALRLIRANCRPTNFYERLGSNRRNYLRRYRPDQIF